MKLLAAALPCLAFCFADDAHDWSSLLPDAGAGVTLDEEAFSRIRSEMQAEQGSAAPAELPGEAEAWRRAMNSESTEERDARLLALLLRLNPECCPERSLPEFIALLQLHSRAAAGQPKACAELATALRSGAWRGLKLPQDAASAEKLEKRAAF